MRAVRCNPGEANARGKQALALVKLQRWDEAIEAADAALTIAPEDPFAKRIAKHAREGQQAAAHNAAVDAAQAQREEEDRKRREWKILRGEK